MYSHHWKTLVVFIVMLSLSSVSPALGHGAGGTIEIEQDGFLIDIGYSEEEIVTDLPLQLNFLLFELGEGTQGVEAEFTDVWVRIENEAEVVFASLLSRPEFGDTSMSYLFSESGEYELFVRYKNMQDTLVERSVVLNVGEGASSVVAQSEKYSARDLAIVSVLSTILTLIILAVLVSLLRTRISLETNWLQRRSLKADTKHREEKTSLRDVKSVEQTPQTVSDKTTHLVLTTLTAMTIAVATFLIASVFFGTIELPHWNNETDPAPETESSSPAISSTEGASSSEVVNIVLTETGYEPKNITIEQGTTITFSTTAGRPHWPASSLHPTHNEYSEFDPMEPVPAEEAWSFNFEKVGDWSYHDHLRSYFTGKISVVPHNE